MAPVRPIKVAKLNSSHPHSTNEKKASEKRARREKRLCKIAECHGHEIWAFVNPQRSGEKLLRNLRKPQR